MSAVGPSPITVAEYTRPVPSPCAVMLAVLLSTWMLVRASPDDVMIIPVPATWRVPPARVAWMSTTAASIRATAEPDAEPEPEPPRLAAGRPQCWRRLPARCGPSGQSSPWSGGTATSWSAPRRSGPHLRRMRSRGRPGEFGVLPASVVAYQWQAATAAAPVSTTHCGWCRLARTAGAAARRGGLTVSR